MPRLGHLLTALAAFGVLAVALLGGHKSDAVAFQLADAGGALTLANSHAGEAIFHGEGLRPGVPVNGSVTLGNTGAGAAALALQATPESESAGAGGGRLSDALALRISDVTDPAAPAVLYDGPASGLGRRALGTLAPGAARTYELTAELPAATSDAYQGARLSLGFTWTATGPDAAVAPTPTAPPAAPAVPPAPAADPDATVTADGLAALPSAQACVKRARLTIRLKRPRGVTVGSVTVRVAHRKPLRPKGTKVVLKQLPTRGRYTVTVTTRLASGRTLKSARTYRACRASR
jgi:hypothetical protein